MTLYFDTKLPEIAGAALEISFHSCQPRLAIRSFSSSTNQGVVSIYDADGILLDSEVRAFKVRKFFTVKNFLGSKYF